MRNAFIAELIQAARTDPRIMLVVGDLGFSVVEPFVREFPQRFVNAGVAEQDMMGICAGLASEGFHPFAYSIANFPTFRCAEQIRNDIDYHRWPVTIVSVGGGLSYGNLGYSHHAVQDMGLMRMLPHMLLAAPACPMEVRACVRYLVANPQPSYLRLGKAGERALHPEVPQVEPGRWLRLRGGGPGGASSARHGTVLTTGAAAQLVAGWIDQAVTPAWAGASLHTLPLWGMACKTAQADQARQWREIVTVEDHLADGGFGSWLLEALNRASRDGGHAGRHGPAVHIHGLDPVVCGTVGRQSTLDALGGLRPDAIAPPAPADTDPR